MESNAKPAAHRLSFVSTTSGKIGFWTPDRSGDYSLGIARGKAYATELLAFMDREKNPVIFGSVVRAMVDAGRYEAVEIGFCQAIGLQLADVALEPMRREMVAG